MQASRQKLKVETNDLQARQRKTLRKWAGVEDADRNLLRVRPDEAIVLT